MRARLPDHQGMVERNGVRAGLERNRHFWRQDGGYRDWTEFLFGQQLPERHSTKQYEDAVGWALETDAEAMIAEREWRAAPPAREAGPLCRRVRCPVRVLHGSDDRCQPVARGRPLAELTGGDLVVLEGAGHLPHGRDPVKATRLITEFADPDHGSADARHDLDPRPVPPGAGSVPVLTHRARPRPP
jgi:pimeloyl-ACP methyl ester carboxylesterase